MTKQQRDIFSVVVWPIVASKESTVVRLDVGVENDAQTGTVALVGIDSVATFGTVGRSIFGQHGVAECGIHKGQITDVMVAEALDLTRKGLTGVGAHGGDRPGRRRSDDA